MGGSQEQEDYPVKSTLWLIGQFFCWVEILHREVQFLRLKSDTETVSVQQRIHEIRTTFASEGHDDWLRVYRAWQRAIGEKMIATGRDVTGAPRTDCMGYAGFAQCLEEPQFNRWFQPLTAAIDELTSGKVFSRRLILLQHQLLALINELDVPPLRFPGQREEVDEREYSARVAEQKRQ